ncbi:MAG: hypothetical protein Q4F65_05655 [Propionibacteriaceae bacterium]|nr:hypothetical protein [Propionibacteriaceae bacterium]
MRAHLRAVVAALEPLGYPVHLLHANPPGDDASTVPPVPYLVLRGAWANPDDMPACDATDDLDTALFITGTASTAEGALVVLDRVRRHLSPSMRPTRLDLAGRAAQVRWVRNEVEPQVDRDLRLPNSNRHPGFGVDSYRLTSQPL